MSFHRAPSATAHVYQPVTFSAAGGPLVQQAPLVHQTMLNKDVITTGITNQMSSSSLANVPHQTVFKPAIVEEIVRTDRIVQVQPVIHREIEQQRVHHIEQHITERAAPSTAGTVQLAPIIQEIVHTNVIEEVQPIIHREVVQQQIEVVEEHLTERVAAPAIHTHETLTSNNTLSQYQRGILLHKNKPLPPINQGTTIVKPAIVEERVRTDRVVEVQPIVHREIIQPRIHHVEQHISEPAAPSTAGIIKMTPVIQEIVHTNVIEEVQPIIHREVVQQQVEVVEEHLTERVAAPAIHTREVQNINNNVVNEQGIFVHKHKPLPPIPVVPSSSFAPAM